MRKKQRKSAPGQAESLLRDAPFYSVAGTRKDGAPVLRTLNGVLVDDFVLFHGALAGEKTECLSRPGVVSAYEVIADIPSYFVDPDKACPATTYYRSVQANGTLMDIDDPQKKIEMFAAFMEKYQPEGGHLPFSDEVYRKDLRSVRVFGLKVEAITGKSSLGQDRPSERTERVVRGLWKRGNVGDLSAIEEILRESPTARPKEWTHREGVDEFMLRVHPTDEEICAHAALLRGQYWRVHSRDEKVRRAISKSSAWVGAFSQEGVLVGAARAVSDGHWMTQISDVVVSSAVRGRGLGSALVRLLLDHPQVSGCPHKRLGTKDAMPFYERFGFSQKSIDLGYETYAMARTDPSEF